MFRTMHILNRRKENLKFKILKNRLSGHFKF